MTFFWDAISPLFLIFLAPLTALANPTLRVSERATGTLECD